MINTITIFFLIVQLGMSFYFCYPFILNLISLLKSKSIHALKTLPEVDYAIIVTAYEQTLLIPNVVNSILKLFTLGLPIAPE